MFCDRIYTVCVSIKLYFAEIDDLIDESKVVEKAFEMRNGICCMGAYCVSVYYTFGRSISWYSKKFEY